MSMKTFEERYTAYLDGLLSESEAAILEQERPALVAQKAEWAKLQRVLRENLVSLGWTWSSDRGHRALYHFDTSWRPVGSWIGLCRASSKDDHDRSKCQRDGRVAKGNYHYQIRGPRKSACGRGSDALIPNADSVIRS